MYIHIGGDIVIRLKDIISIININEMNLKKKNYLIKNYDKVLQVEKINNEIKSLVVTTDKIYCSPISSLTLCKRANNY